MKKLGVLFLFSILLIGVFVISIAKAEELSQPPLPKGTEEIAKAGETLSNLDKENIKDQYLKTEWNKILINKPYIGPVISFIDSVFSSLNPFFKAVLGIDYSFSWAFVFALAIWIILFVFLFQPSREIFDSMPLAVIGSFAITSLIGLSGVIKQVVNLLTIAITNTWIFWASVAITILIGFLIIYLGGGLQQIIKKEKEKSKKSQTEKDRKIIHTDAEISKKNLDSYKD